MIKIISKNETLKNQFTQKIIKKILKVVNNKSEL